MSEIKNDSLVTNLTNQSDINGDTSIQQTRDDSILGDSQSKIGDIFNKSISERVASVVGDITKGFFKEFFGVKFKEGDVPEGNNVSERVTAKKVIKGLFGVVAALPFLIGMGSLYIANMVRFAAKKEEDIYAYELNKLLQSGNANDKKQAIYFLEKILANGKSTVKYNAAKNFLIKDIRPLYTCLGSTDEKLKNDTKELLTNMLKNEDPDIKAVADKIVRDCLASGNRTLKANTIALLTDMFKSTDIDTENTAKEIINSKAFEGCIKSYDSRLKPILVSLFTTMLKNEKTKVTAEGIVKECLESNDLKLKADTITLLADMLNDENSDEYEVAQMFLSGEKELIDKVQDGLSEMLDNKAIEVNAIKILENAFEGATQSKEDFYEKEIPHKKGFLVKNLDDLEVIEKDSSIELLLKKMFDKNETKGLAIKVINYLESKNLYSDELREYFSEKNKNDNIEALDQEEVLDKD